MKNYTVSVKSFDELYPVDEDGNDEHDGFGEGWIEYVQANSAAEAKEIAMDNIRKAIEQPDVSLEADILEEESE